MDHRPTHIPAEQEKKGTKLLSILDKLRHSVQDNQESSQEPKPDLSLRTAEEERNDVTGIEIGTEQRCETQESNSADELPTLDDLMKSEPTIKATQPSHEVVKYNDRDSDLGSFVRVSSETVTVNPTDQSVAGVENGEVTAVPLELCADEEMTVVPLDDTGQLGIDGIVDGEDGEKLVRVWTHEVPEQDTSNDIDDQISKEQLYAGLTEEDLPTHVKCTSCGKKTKTMTQKLSQHPVLAVLMCKPCNKFYNSSSFSRDKFGMEEFCKWCGDGGELICCDFCEKVFCQKCVKRNMGSEFLKILLDADEEKWKCFSCDPTQIENFTDECRIIMKILKRMKMKGYAFENKKTHLGGPSQFERKERLINIGHTLEEKGFTSDEIIKIEIDPDINISAVEAKGNDQVQSPKGKKASKGQKSKGKPKDKSSSEESRKETMLENDNLEDVKSPDVVLSSCEVEIREVDRSLANKNNQVGNKDKNTENLDDIDDTSDVEKRTCSDQVLSPKEMSDLKEKYSIKGLRVFLERVKIPENCILPSARDAELENEDFGADCREGLESVDASKEADGSGRHSKNRKADKRNDAVVQIVLLSDSEEENETTKDNVDGSTANDVKNSNSTDKKMGSSKTGVPDGKVIDDSTGSGNGKVVKKGKDSKDFLRCVKEDLDDHVNEDNIHNDNDSRKKIKKQSRKSLKTERTKKSIESDNESRSGSLIDLDDLDYDSDESEFKPSDDSDDVSSDNSDSNDNGDSGNNDDKEMFEDEDVDAAVAGDVKLEDSFENMSGKNRQDSSDSEYDYQRLASRSIRHRGKMKEVGGKERVGTTKQVNSAKDKASDEELKSESSDDSLPQKSPRKRKRKGNPRKKHVSSESDSDFATRTKKRPRRRKLSEYSSRSESEESDSNGDEEDDDRKGKGKRRSKKKRKGTKGTARKGKGKRRKTRSKVINSDSEGSSDDDDDDDDKSPSKNKGRKNIRRLLAEEELTEETRKARQLEEERRQRLLERTQKTYEEEQSPQKLDMTGRIVLEVDKKSGRPLVEVHESLRPHLKPHQVEGIKFMYDCLFESLEKFEAGDKGNGALLAHCMGLGKTLQIIALLHTVMNHRRIGLTRFLVVAPLNTVYNWENEFDKWLELDERMDVHVLSDSGHNMKLRISMLREWYKNGGVMILGYDMYRNLSQFNRIKNKKFKKVVTETLLDPGPDIVVCDEGHIIRNDLSAISKALSKIKTSRRVVLTGTPLQNNLSEYFVMVSFVKPNLLGTKREFTNLFMNPIINGQCSNSTVIDVRTMKQRCHVLHDMLSGCVQRKDYSVLTPFLTPKHEYTIFVRLGERQRKMYRYYLEQFVCGNLSEVRARGSGIFADYQCLMKIWTHPWAVKLEAIKRMEREKFDEMEEFLDDSESEAESSLHDKGDSKEKNVSKDTWKSSDSEEEAEESASSESLQNSASGSENQEKSDDEVKQSSRQRSTRSRNYPSRSKVNDTEKAQTKDKNTLSLKYGKTQVTLDRDIFDADDSDEKSDAEKMDTDEIVVIQPKEEPVRGIGNTRSGVSFKDGPEIPIEEEKEWYDEFINDGDDTNVELSGKLVLLLEILANAEIVGDKVLVFSQSLVSLDLIERTLGGGQVDGNESTWCKGVDYFRLDGSTPAKTRQRYAEIFNDVENTSARLFLISTKAGSLGVNLVAANRVIVFDCSWNPSHDVQSIFRVYRFGQDKPVYVYRLISQGEIPYQAIQNSTIWESLEGRMGGPCGCQLDPFKGTMEQKIYERQINKLALSGRVVDEQQISRHFTDEEIRELYAFTAEEYKEGGEVPTPQLPADPLLAEVLTRQHPKWIVQYHEHDLLLENVEDEQLTEEERKQAWASYEEQKSSASRQLARAEEQLRLSQERVAAFQQQQQQLLELQRQQQLSMANQMQQIRNIVPSMNGINRPPGMIGQMPPMSSMSAEERFRNLQIINLANLRNSIPQMNQWNQPAVRTNFSLPVSRQMNPRSVRIIEVPRHRNPHMQVNIPRVPLHRLPHQVMNSNTETGIRIVRVEGSLPRNTNFRH